MIFICSLIVDGIVFSAENALSSIILLSFVLSLLSTYMSARTDEYIVFMSTSWAALSPHALRILLILFPRAVGAEVTVSYQVLASSDLFDSRSLTGGVRVILPIT